MLNELTRQLLEKNPLSAEQTAQAVAQLVQESVPVETKADFLAALSNKGETVEEIAAFARELREMSIKPPLDAETRSREILDVCGTGGDHVGTFNISTTVAIVAAAAGITVAKHGNRAVTSKSGSADVLEALGIKIDLTPEQAAENLKRHHFTFFFAPRYHPAFKNIAPARKLCAERKQRTIFNLLGPLLNPARPTAQLIGVPKPHFCEPVARVLQTLGVRRGMVICGCAVDHPEVNSRIHLDELSIFGENCIAEFYQDRGFHFSTMQTSEFPLQRAEPKDLAGGDNRANAEIIVRILNGDDRGPKRDAVLLNAAAALFVAGKTKSFAAGWELAGEVIDTGKAREKLSALRG